MSITGYDMPALMLILVSLRTVEIQTIALGDLCIGLILKLSF